MKFNYGKYHSKNVSGKFLIGILLTTLICLCCRFYADDSATNLITLQAFFKYSRLELLQLGESASAYQVMMSFRDMEWFVVILPLLAAFPSVYDFAEEWFSGSYYLTISRTSRTRYAISRIGGAAAKAFLAILFGIALYTILVSLKFPHYQLYQIAPDESMIAMAYGDTFLLRLITFLKAVFHTGLLAALAAMISTVFVVVIKSRFLAVSLPVLIEYFSMKMASAYESRLFSKYNFDEVPVREHLVEFFFPSNHLFYDQSFIYTYGQKYWLYLVFMGIIVFAVLIWFWYLVERRCD